MKRPRLLRRGLAALLAALTVVVSPVSALEVLPPGNVPIAVEEESEPVTSPGTSTPDASGPSSIIPDEETSEPSPEDTASVPSEPSGPEEAEEELKAEGRAYTIPAVLDNGSGETISFRSTSGTVISVINGPKWNNPDAGSGSVYPYCTFGGKVAYCVDSTVPYTTGGTYYEQSTDFTKLDQGKKETVSYILKYGSPQGNSPGMYNDWHAATQCLIWEVINGLRKPYTLEGSQSKYYTNLHAVFPGMESYYNKIIGQVKSWGQIPSFAAHARGNAPTHKMTGSKLELTNTNSTCNLSDFKFTANGLTFSASGNTLSISSSSELSGDVLVECDRKDASGTSDNYIFWIDPKSHDQARMSPGPDPVPCYFKLGQEASVPEEPDDPEPEPDYFIEITKLEEGTDIPLSGAEFTLEYLGGNGEIIIVPPAEPDAPEEPAAASADINEPEHHWNGSVTSDGSGKARIQVPYSGVYKITEVTPPANHKLSKVTVQTVRVNKDTPNGTAYVTYHNEAYTGVRVRKIDAKSSQPVAGATIRLEQIDGDMAMEGVTGADGTFLFEPLPVNSYRIYEKTAPDSYVVNTTVYTAEAKPNQIVEVVIPNTPKPGLIIRKVDQDGTPLQGCVFSVSEKDGAPIGEYISDRNGLVVLQKLPKKWITVTEKQPPAHHLIDPDNATRDVNMMDGDDQEIVFRNPRKPSLLVEKIDRNHPEKKLAGAVIRVSIEDSAEYTELTTEPDGTALLEDLPLTWLTVWEVQAPSGYLLSEQKQIIQLEAGKTARAVFKDKKKPSLLIKKVDELSGDGLEGVTLRVQRDGAAAYQDVTTGPDGTALLTGMDPGWVTVTELRTLDSHILDTTPHHIELRPGDSPTLLIKNRAKPALEIVKTDKLTKQPIRHARFRIQLKNGKDLGVFETNEAGVIYLPNAEPGLYVITEIACDGYHLLEEPIEALVEWGKVKYVPVENTPMNPLLIYKTNQATGEPVSGCRFSVSRVDGAFVGEFESGSNGYCTILGQEPGFFVVTEIEAAPGFIRDDVPKTVELTRDAPAVVRFENKPLNGIRIYKYDSSDEGKGLEGAKFRITQKDGKLVGEYRSGPRGEIVVDQLSPGWYTITEIEPPSPEYLLDSKPRDVYLDWNDYVSVEWANTKFSGLQILKKNSVDGSPIQGVTIRVERLADNKLVGDFVTDESGSIAVSLKPGAYRAYERETVPGFVLDSTPQTFEISKGESNKTLIFKNKPLIGMQLRKVDSITKKPISSVRFTFRELDGRLIGSFETDKTGTIFIPGLREGWLEYAEEAPADGYKGDSAFKRFEVKADRLNLIEEENSPWPILSILKTDPEGKPLEGVKIKLFDSFNRELGTFTTSKSGKLVLTGIDAGSYFCQEYATIEGYQLDQTLHPVSLEWGKTTPLQIVNQPLAAFRLRKIDAVSKKPVYGVHFLLSDEKNNPIGEFVTDQAGVIELPRTLAAQKLQVKEIQAAPGYVPSDQVYTVQLKAGETAELVVENEPQRGRIQISKTSADDNPITKEKAGCPLEGALFEIYDQANEVVDRITSDSRGIATSKPLPLGIYGCREVSSPEFYQLNPKPFWAEIKVHDDLVQFEVQNASESLSVNVEKRGNIEAMPGDTIRYDFKNIQNNSTVALEDFYWRDVLPTDALRLERIHTGTWSEHLEYGVWYKTNQKGYRLLKDGLSTEISYDLGCGRDALGLGGGEYITEVKFEFGTVQPEFREKEAPYLLCAVNGDLPSKYRFRNCTDVGGKRHDEWVLAKDCWVTVVYAGSKGKLPKTGLLL